MKKFVAGVAAVLAVVMTFGLAACGGDEPNRNLTEAEYKAYLEGVRNMTSRTINYRTATTKDDDNEESRNSYMYIDAENEKVKLHTVDKKEVDGENERYINRTSYYAVDGDKAYFYNGADARKHDVTQTVTENEQGDTLWDKLVYNYLLNEDLMILDLIRFKNESHPEGLAIDELFNELTWNKSYTYSSEKNPAEIHGEKYVFGYRWSFTGTGTFDINLGEMERENVEVSIYLEENTETGKLLSKDYTDGSFSISLWQEGEEIDTWQMWLNIRTFNLWYIAYDNEDVFVIPEDEFYPEEN